MGEAICKKCGALYNFKRRMPERMACFCDSTKFKILTPLVENHSKPLHQFKV